MDRNDGSFNTGGAGAPGFYPIQPVQNLILVARQPIERPINSFMISLVPP